MRPSRARRGEVGQPARRNRLAPVAAAWRERIFLLNQQRRLRRIARYHVPPRDQATLLDAVRRKALVFTVTAGRSGTTYLARLLALLPRTTSLHEPAPNFAYFLRQAQRAPELARRFWLEYKLPHIAALPTPRYVEASHLFGKGFLDPLLDLGVLPGVVMLRRHPRLVAMSWLTRGVIPGRGKRGLKLHLHPGDPGVLAFPDWCAASDYQLCFWYALEMERRQRAYADLLTGAGGAVVDVTPDELHEPARFLDIAETLGLLDAGVEREPLLRGHREVSSVVHKPNPRPPVVAIPEQEAAVWSAVAAQAPWLYGAIEQRYAPPPSPARRAARGAIANPSSPL
jgi:hypothetical protein